MQTRILTCHSRSTLHLDVQLRNNDRSAGFLFGQGYDLVLFALSSLVRAMGDLSIRARCGRGVGTTRRSRSAAECKACCTNGGRDRYGQHTGSHASSIEESELTGSVTANAGQNTAESSARAPCLSVLDTDDGRHEPGAGLKEDTAVAKIEELKLTSDTPAILGMPAEKSSPRSSLKPTKYHTDFSSSTKSCRKRAQDNSALPHGVVIGRANVKEEQDVHNKGDNSGRHFTRQMEQQNVAHRATA